ncbi:phosphotransferase family protein [Deinococcus humi]|uniref:Aminoglycoside 2''-phosphotransferase n=1 Tax=Deinococcus humi TaxID=662880 RepID=A0A7W8JSQ8_9DEIO|nr:phosphotransferase [Deinococcus humi]MBB5362449.1 aminoglycoside 2''-phosphotransferase [Deinococcus humi]GGO28767.1 hypothetical protein GCM10008949_21620 [Deinococcus humi]
MITHAPERALQACLPDLPTPQLMPAGQGDYCQAWSVHTTPLRVLLLARHNHASHCLERVARVMPHLAGTLTLRAPQVECHGRLEGRAFVLYEAVPGTPLGYLNPQERGEVDAATLARDLATFFRELHAFDPALARRSGVPETAYAFSMRDDHMLHGAAPDLYRQDLAEYRTGGADEDLTAFLEAELEGHLRLLRSDDAPPALLHGEVSVDHVLVDEGRAVGVIDFNGMTLGRPARDLLYLHETFGLDWTCDLLTAYSALDVKATLTELGFLRVWHTLLRLLWAREHGLPDLAARRQHELLALMTRRRTD